MEWQGRSAIVTGGAGGLGAATVRRLVDLGLRWPCSTSMPTGPASWPRSWVSVALGVGGDVNDDDAVVPAIEAARSLGPLSILVNVAGGGVGGGRTVAVAGCPTTRTPSSRPWR